MKDGVTDPLTLARSSARHAAERGASLAVVDGPVRWSWIDLHERARAVAAGLRAAGAGPGSRIALLTQPSAAAIAALHGIALMGAAAAPVGRGLTPVELTAAVAAIDPHLVVHDKDRAAEAVALGRPVIALGQLLTMAGGPATADTTAGGPDRPSACGPATADTVARGPATAETDEGAPAAIVLTSGTTGRPKAVVLSGTALRVSAEAWLAVLPPATGWVLAVGLGHVAGLGVVWRAALDGVPLVIVGPSDSGAILAALTGDLAPSHVSLVPTQLLRLLDAADAAADVAAAHAYAKGATPPPSLRAILLGGGPIPVALVERALAGGWPVVPTYGLSEAASAVTALPTSEAARHPGSAGRPLPGVELRIDAADRDGIGEIVVRTPARFTGYLHDPDETAAVLTSDGWLRTGDLGRLDGDGRLTVVDRRTDRIVRGGLNIAPAEIEAVLLTHPAIADAAVVARADATWGQVPVAAIVLRPGAPDPGDEALVAHGRAHLAAAKVPVAFVRVVELPRTASGKLRRAEVRARLSEHVGRICRPDGVFIAYRQVGAGAVPVLLLHGTLSTSKQLNGLARALAEVGEVTVIAVDRRGSGLSRLSEPEPVDVATHVADLAAVLDALGWGAAAMVGVSFGGVVALEAAARLPDRCLAGVVYEPPYGAVADARTRRVFGQIAHDTALAWRAGGSPAAAETFLRGVGGDEAWAGLSDRGRAFLADEGAGAVVDSALLGLDPGGLERIDRPVTIVTGDASDPVYQPIAASLIARIPNARHLRLPGAHHAAPITDPRLFADAVVGSLRAAGLFDPPPSGIASEETMP